MRHDKGEAFGDVGGARRRPPRGSADPLGEAHRERLGAPPVKALFAHLTQRGDGRGRPGQAKATSFRFRSASPTSPETGGVPHMLAGDEGAVGILRQRSGGALDPVIASATPALPCTRPPMCITAGPKTLEPGARSSSTPLTGTCRAVPHAACRSVPA